MQNTIRSRTKAQVQIVISEIDEFDDIAREPSLHIPGRNDTVPARPACVKIDSDPAPPPPDFETFETEAAETDKAISIGTQKLTQKSKKASTRDRCPGCRRFLWAKCWQDPRWRKCGLITAALVWVVVIALAISLGLLWPRDPSWRLTSLQMDVDALMSLVTAASSGPSVIETAVVPDQVFRAEVEVNNPNLVGAESQAGQFHFIFEGRNVGAGMTGPATIPPQSVATVVAEGALQVDKDLLHAMASELSADSPTVPTLNFEILAESDFQSIFGMELHYQMHCKIDFSIPDLMMSDTRARAVTGRECKHTVNF